VERFNIEALHWDALPRRVELAKAVVRETLPRLTGEERVLDFGAGTGLVGLNLAPFVREVVGIDTSEKMVEQFNLKAKKLNFPNSRALHRDIFQLEGEFDFIVSSMTLHHIPDLPRVAEKIAQLAPRFGIADLVVEDGSFHTRGNQDVYHFGFTDEQLFKIFAPYFKNLEFRVIHTVRKERGYPIFYLYGERKW
jgi:SAM-dependent methyltransferase